MEECARRGGGLQGVVGAGYGLATHLPRTDSQLGWIDERREVFGARGGGDGLISRKAGYGEHCERLGNDG